MRQGTSYPVVWAEPGAAPAAGRLTPGTHALLLEGTARGRLERREVPYTGLAGVRVGHPTVELLGGRRALVVERLDAPPILISPVGPGLLSELADVLAELSAEDRRIEQVAVVVPLKPGSFETVRAFLAEGPPFDPGALELVRHAVFLDGQEAIFVFAGHDASASVRQIVENAAVLPIAERWSDCIAGPPRLAEVGYSWSAAQ